MRRAIRVNHTSRRKIGDTHSHDLASVLFNLEKLARLRRLTRSHSLDLPSDRTPHADDEVRRFVGLFGRASSLLSSNSVSTTTLLVTPANLSIPHALSHRVYTSRI